MGATNADGDKQKERVRFCDLRFCTWLGLAGLAGALGWFSFGFDYEMRAIVLIRRSSCEMFQEWIWGVCDV